MQFAHVTGTLFADDYGYVLLVTLDARTTVTTVRQERVSGLLRGPTGEDAVWTVDQLTQETIGTTLAEQGWEALAPADSRRNVPGGPPTVTYLIRRL